MSCAVEKKELERARQESNGIEGVYVRGVLRLGIDKSLRGGEPRYVLMPRKRSFPRKHSRVSLRKGDRKKAKTLLPLHFMQFRGPSKGEKAATRGPSDRPSIRLPEHRSTSHRSPSRQNALPPANYPLVDRFTRRFFLPEQRRPNKTSRCRPSVMVSPSKGTRNSQIRCRFEMHCAIGAARGGTRRNKGDRGSNLNYAP